MDEMAQLLRRWSAKDDGVVPRIVELALPSVHRAAKASLGAELRSKLDSEDVVQDSVVEFLVNGPRLVPETPAQLFELLGRIVANTVRDKCNWFRAARREMAREQPMDRECDPQASSSAGPVRQVMKGEDADRLRLALEMMRAADRRVLMLHLRERLTFPAIGQTLGISEEAARSTFRRANDKLLQCMMLLKQGRFDAALDATIEPAPGEGASDDRPAP